MRAFVVNRLQLEATRKLSLTEAGQIYYERAARIIMEVDEARLAISELGSPTGILRVARQRRKCPSPNVS